MSQIREYIYICQEGLASPERRPNNHQPKGPIVTELHTIPLTARNASLADIMAILEQQQAHKVDVVASASRIQIENGNLHLTGTDPILTADGVTATEGFYRPTEVCDAGIGEKLGIDLRYLRKCRSQAIDLYDANVNGWLQRADGKAYLIRCLADGAGGTGIARAFLSDQYKVVDNLDSLMAILQGVKESGMSVTINCDLSERRMVVRVTSEEIRALAPTLLRNYRSPFTGKTGADNPTVFAGFEFTNSETGGGAHLLTPRIVVQVCDNGMKINKDALRTVHLGSRMEEGMIRWSGDTREANLALITKKTRDAVATFLDVKYVEKKIIEIEEKSGHKVTDPEDTITVVSQKLRFTEEERRSILNHFIDGGDRTAGGVMHAVTSVAQTLTDPDAAFEMENNGIRAMEIAANI
jgi:hypothetical protein